MSLFFFLDALPNFAAGFSQGSASMHTRRSLRWPLAGGMFLVAAASALIASGRLQADAKSKPQGEARAAQGKVLLDPNDTIVLLLDHQTGLFQTVKDIPIAELRTNTMVLAKIAELAKAPILTTASEPNGTNGPLMAELAAAAPNAKYIPRKGEVSAWDNEDFKAAVKASGKKTLIMAGVWTSVCVAFPALQAKAEGYNVYYVMDASGDMSQMASQATLARMTAGGIVPVTTNVVLCEFQRTWARPDAAQWGALYSELVPHYRAVTESYLKAQDVAGQKKQ
jgi:nicotinamidase-related amidase